MRAQDWNLDLDRSEGVACNTREQWILTVEADLGSLGRISSLHCCVYLGLQLAQIRAAFVGHVNAKLSPEEPILRGIFVVIVSGETQSVVVGFPEDNQASS